MTNPIDDEELYDVIKLGGLASPGVVKSITGHDREAKWDVKAGSGQKGATTTLKEQPPANITVTLYLADQADFDAWPAFRAMIESTIKPKVQARDIYHPDLAEANITSVCQGKIVGTAHDGKGGQTRVFTLQEYLPPKPAGGTPLGSFSQGQQDPNAKALAEIAKLTAQYQEAPPMKGNP